MKTLMPMPTLNLETDGFEAGNGHAREWEGMEST